MSRLGSCEPWFDVGAMPCSLDVHDCCSDPQTDLSDGYSERGLISSCAAKRPTPQVNIVVDSASTRVIVTRVVA